MKRRNSMIVARRYPDVTTFHVVVSVQTGLVAEWYDEAHCPACGIVIDRQTIEDQLDRGNAPCCDTCAPIVREHLSNPTPWWPNGWWGKWFKIVSEPTWMLPYERTENGD